MLNSGKNLSLEGCTDATKNPAGRIKEQVYALIRADEVHTNGHMGAIVIDAHSNIQDGVVIYFKFAANSQGQRTGIRVLRRCCKDEHIVG